MKQLHVKNYRRVLYGGGTQTINLLDAGTQPGGANGITVAIPVIARNLSLYCAKPTHTEITLVVQKNGVDTALSVTSGAGVITPVTNTVDSISYVSGDIIRARFVGPGYLFNDAPSLGVCIETEGAENIYGQSADLGGLGREIGGALGNGHSSNYGGALPPGPAAPSNSHSISALAGTLTGLAARCSVVPGANVYTSYVVKNGVIQDGAGGSVDTRCILTGATQFLYQTFSLPVSILDIFDVLTIRTGAVVVANVSNCVTFNPTTVGRFMFCGGSNAAISSALDYRWNDSSQDGLPEEQKAGVIGPGGVVVHGLYIAKESPGPLPSQTTTNTLRRSSTDTDLSVTLVQLQNSGSDLTPDETFPEDSSIDIKCTNTNGGNGNSLFWSSPVSVIEPGSLIVQKITRPLSDQVFDFSAGGGLSPTSFSLQNGDVQVFSGLSAGTYSIAETPVDGWTVSIEVSNGDDPSAIDFGSGDMVTVTATNTLTCPGLVTAPRLDGLPYVPPSFDPCAGTGTRGSPRIGA